jgi:carbon monoxide dehydrogenase subunit G
MKVSGTATLNAPVERVWAALMDPAVLVRTIPGCERLEATGENAYSMTVTAGVASIKGTYAGKVALTDFDHPRSFVLRASGAGGPGTVSTDVTVALTPAGDGSTTLTYDADAIVGGVIAGVGQRMLSGVSKKMAGEFFRAVDDVLTGKAVAVAAAAAEGAAPGVFTAPPAAPSRLGGLIPSGSGFVAGAVVGAAIALAGVVVGGLLGRRVRS